MAQTDFLTPAGTYMFTWSTVAADAYTAYTDMYMNDDAIASSFCNSASSEVSYSCSNTVVHHCQSGARVYIQCSPARPCRFRSNSDVNGALQSFAGFLLSAQD